MAPIRPPPILASPSASPVVQATGDADGDGTPNGSDPAPTNPCIPNADAVPCPTGDADDDDTPNGTDPANRSLYS